MADLLNIGISGLYASKKSLATTGHNLANADTEGYSRKRVQQVTNPPLIKDGLLTGTGVRIKGINRIHDPFVEKSLNQNISKHEYFQERYMQLSKVEDIFAEVNGEGLNKVLTNFYNSFRELANQPENETIRSVVRDNARLVINDFHRIRSTLDDIARYIDKKMHSEVTGINQTIQTIAGLNRRIAILEAGSEECGDLRDQRDLEVRNLSKIFNVNAYVDGRGNYCVSAKGVGTLVTAANYQEFMSAPQNKEDSVNNMAGSVEVYFQGRQNHPVTQKFSGGILSSMVDIRNNDLFKIQNDIDNIAFDFAQTVNAVHRRGYVNRTIPISENGEAAKYDDSGPTSGVNFFEIPQDRHNAASVIELSKAVRNDLSNISTALLPNSPGDNRISLAISKLQHIKMFDEGTATLEEKYLQTIANVGLETGKARLDNDQSEGIVTQTHSLRERISGVSIDEETANLIRYQNAYEASAKVMATANETFDTVIGLIR